MDKWLLDSLMEDAHFLSIMYDDVVEEDFIEFEEVRTSDSAYTDLYKNTTIKKTHEEIYKWYMSFSRIPNAIIHGRCDKIPTNTVVFNKIYKDNFKVYAYAEISYDSVNKKYFVSSLGMLPTLFNDNSDRFTEILTDTVELFRSENPNVKNLDFGVVHKYKGNDSIRNGLYRAGFTLSPMKTNNFDYYIYHYKK